MAKTIMRHAKGPARKGGSATNELKRKGALLPISIFKLKN
jgi:hypothetical protein